MFDAGYVPTVARSSVRLIRHSPDEPAPSIIAAIREQLRAVSLAEHPVGPEAIADTELVKAISKTALALRPESEVLVDEMRALWDSIGGRHIPAMQHLITFINRVEGSPPRLQRPTGDSRVRRAVISAISRVIRAGDRLDDAPLDPADRTGGPKFWGAVTAIAAALGVAMVLRRWLLG